MALTAKQLSIMDACRALHAAGRTITRVTVQAKTGFSPANVDRALNELMLFGLLHRRPGPGAPCYLLPPPRISRGEVILRNGVKVTLFPPGYADGYGRGCGDP